LCGHFWASFLFIVFLFIVFEADTGFLCNAQ
jgi:hypothetical protein